MNQLKKELDFKDIYFIGLGYIIGAGIYSLLHLTTKKGKHFTWLSFLFGGLISLITARSYIYLNKEYNSSASEYEYITDILGFGKYDSLKLCLLILILLKGILISSTLSIAFGELVSKMINNKLSSKFITFLLIFSITLLNSFDLKTTVNTNTLITLLEAGVLIILIIFGTKKIKMKENYSKTLDVTGISTAAFLSIFAFSGFEGIPKLINETQNSSEIIPKAIRYSLITSIALYILTSLVINSLLGVNNVKKYNNPISVGYQKLFNLKFGLPVNILTSFSIFNTVLLTILILSRQLYGIGKSQNKEKLFKSNIMESVNDLFTVFTSVNSKTNTPIYSILFVGLIIYLITLFFNLEKANYLSNFVILIIYILVNLSSLKLYLKKQKNKTI